MGKLICSYSQCNLPVKGCNCFNSWKNTACSREHYLLYMDEFELRKSSKPKGVTNTMAYKLRVFDGMYMYDVPDYEITKDDVIMQTGIEGRTISLADTEYLIVLSNEKATLLKTYENNGSYEVVNKADYETKIKFAESKPGGRSGRRSKAKTTEVAEVVETVEADEPDVLETFDISDEDL